MLRRRGIIIVAAAGNRGPASPPLYPAAYRSTIAVTATDARSRIYSRANRGDYVFVAAPGVDVLAPVPRDDVEGVSGTSFAAAFLSGLLALRVEQTGGLTPTQAQLEISRSVKDLGRAGRDQIFGHGLVDAAQLLNR